MPSFETSVGAFSTVGVSSVALAVASVAGASVVASDVGATVSVAGCAEVVGATVSVAVQVVHLTLHQRRRLVP